MRSDSANEIKISVIIPVYNVETWIGECIESLKKQKQDGLEFIFVDDCGTDNSIIKIRDKSYDEHLPQSNLNEKIELSLTAGRPLYRILTYEH